MYIKLSGDDKWKTAEYLLYISAKVKELSSRIYEVKYVKKEDAEIAHLLLNKFAEDYNILSDHLDKTYLDRDKKIDIIISDTTS